MNPGTYRAKAVGGTWEHVGQNQTPCIKIDFKLQDNDEHIVATLWLTPKATERTFDTLIAVLGYNEEKPLFQDGEKQWFDHTHLADKEVELVVEDETYEGKTMSRVKWINDVGGTRKSGGTAPQKVLGNLNLKQAAAAARARMGTKKPEPDLAF